MEETKKLTVPRHVYFPTVDGNIIVYDVESVNMYPSQYENFCLNCEKTRYYADEYIPIGFRTATFYQSDIGKIAFTVRENAEKALGTFKENKCKKCRWQGKGKREYPCSRCKQIANDHFEEMGES